MQLNVNRQTAKCKLDIHGRLQELTDMGGLKEQEALLVVIMSKNSNSLHFAVYTTCMPSHRIAAQ